MSFFDKLGSFSSSAVAVAGRSRILDKKEKESEAGEKIFYKFLRWEGEGGLCEGLWMERRVLMLKLSL